MEWQANTAPEGVRCYKIPDFEHFSEITIQDLLGFFNVLSLKHLVDIHYVWVRCRQMVESTFPEVRLFSINSHLVILFWGP